MPPRQPTLRSFDQELSGHRLATQRLIGLRTVRIDRIVGSVGRAGNLRDDFRPHRWRENNRYMNMLRLMDEGAMLPPISLYELLNDYYVLDGHHRVGAARELGMTFMDADVVQFLPDGDSPARRLSQERSRFELTTGLRDIELRDPGAYPLLRNEIDEHKWILGESSDGEVALKMAARSWYEKVYARAVVAIMTRGLARAFPDRTLAEIYLQIEEERWLASEEVGHDVGLQEAVDQLVARYLRHGLGHELERVLIGVRREVAGAGRAVGEVVASELLHRVDQAMPADPYAAVAFQADADQMSISGSGLV